jgi:hypothetical protein
MTAKSAVALFPSQSIGFTPSTPSIWFSTPKSKLYISFQIAPMTMPGTRMGNRKTVR